MLDESKKDKWKKKAIERTKENKKLKKRVKELTESRNKLIKKVEEFKVDKYGGEKIKKNQETVQKNIGMR